MTVKTTSKAVVTTAGKLISDAKQAGIRPGRDDDGRPFWQLEVVDGRLRLQDRPTASNAKCVWEMAEKAQKAGMKGRRDGKGGEFYTLVIDMEKMVAYIEPATEADVKSGRAISPQKD